MTCPQSYPGKVSECPVCLCVSPCMCVCMCACWVSATLSGGSQCCGCRASWGRQPASGCHTQCVCVRCWCACACLSVSVSASASASASAVSVSALSLCMCERCAVCDVRVWCGVMLFAMAVFARGLCACVPLRHDLGCRWAVCRRFFRHHATHHL